MKKTRRTSRVGENVRDALVEIFRRDLKDFNPGLVSISEVEVSPDLHFARVYLTGYTEEETRATAKELQKRRGHIRSLLGKRIHLRYTPELDFKYDETAMRAGRIEALLMEVMPKPELPARDDAADDTDGEDEREPDEE